MTEVQFLQVAAVALIVIGWLTAHTWVRRMQARDAEEAAAAARQGQRQEPWRPYDADVLQPRGQVGQAAAGQQSRRGPPAGRR